eukprot:7383176-Prymnesium_polylepis.3
MASVSPSTQTKHAVRANTCGMLSSAKSPKAMAAMGGCCCPCGGSSRRMERNRRIAIEDDGERCSWSRCNVWDTWR